MSAASIHATGVRGECVNLAAGVPYLVRESYAIDGEVCVCVYVCVYVPVPVLVLVPVRVPERRLVTECMAVCGRACAVLCV